MWASYVEDSACCIGYAKLPLSPSSLVRIRARACLQPSTSEGNRLSAFELNPTTILRRSLLHARSFHVHEGGSGGPNSIARSRYRRRHAVRVLLIVSRCARARMAYRLPMLTIPLLSPSEHLACTSLTGSYKFTCRCHMLKATQARQSS